MNSLISLDLFDVALGLALMAIAIALAAWQRLGLAGQMAIASLRTVLQLLVAGYFLAFVFDLNSPWAVLAVLIFMLSVAAIVTHNRIAPQHKPLFPIIWGSLLAGLFLTLSYIIIAIVQPQIWYSPQYLIPLGGMILGNAMNTAAISGERLASAIDRSAIEIETHLSLGATSQQAVASYRKDAIRAGLIPLINRMMVVGLVTLPGTLTGQVLSGVDPIDAALYQIIIMFMVAFAELVVVLLVTRGISRQFFNPSEQLQGI
ncbi:MULTISPECIES: iron export ABC transporter permease subunit FetB [Spirulina sp. CCY15215]|uniref:ABC transporter permease n=1 Tax=Spirulina sp. CCY15215 TaxID=2767591 RepID=UPI00194DD286